MEGSRDGIGAWSASGRAPPPPPASTHVSGAFLISVVYLAPTSHTYSQLRTPRPLGATCNNGCSPASRCTLQRAASSARPAAREGRPRLLPLHALAAAALAAARALRRNNSPFGQAAISRRAHSRHSPPQPRDPEMPRSVALISHVDMHLLLHSPGARRRRRLSLGADFLHTRACPAPRPLGHGPHGPAGLSAPFLHPDPAEVPTAA